MQFSVPCAVIARFANVLKIKCDKCDEWTNTIRIEDGLVIASNRRLLAVETVGGTSGTIHLIADPVLIAQCAKEATFDSMLEITAEPTLKYATCITTMGYKHSGNCVEWSNSENFLDKWRSVIPTETPPKSVGGMFWDAEQIANLARSSPSGTVVFAENIDVTRPTVIRDPIDPNWFGVFLSASDKNKYPAATLPRWMI